MRLFYNFYAVCVLSAFFVCTCASSIIGRDAEEKNNATQTTTSKPTTLSASDSIDESESTESTDTNSTHTGDSFHLTDLIPSLSVEVKKDGIDVHIRKPQIATRKAWWNGFNVCKEKKVSKESTKEKTEKAAGSSASVSTFVIGGSGEGSQSGVATQCTNDGETYSCTVTHIENDEVQTETTTYKCCNGYKHSDNPRFEGRCVRDRKKGAETNA